MTRDSAASPPLPPRLKPIVEAEYPRYSAAEMARRRAAVEGLLREADLDHLVFCGANRFGTAVQWLTGWPITTEAVTRWPTLKRWADAARRALGAPSLSLIAAAARTAQIAIGRAPPSLRTAPRAVQAFAGGSAMP